ncbi:MAG: hypothetical protein AAB389_03095 [Patescibacteria group bacterium]
MRSQKFIFYSLAALLAVLVFLEYYDLVVYSGLDSMRPWHYDVIEHFIGGVIVAGLFLYYAYVRQLDQFPRQFWVAALMAMGFVALVAVCWELFEFSANIIGQAEQNTLSDTIEDLVIGLLGSVAGSLVILPKVLRK